MKANIPKRIWVPVIALALGLCLLFGAPALVDWTGALPDFAATAALIAALDLVITVDAGTSLAELQEVEAEFEAAVRLLAGLTAPRALAALVGGTAPAVPPSPSLPARPGRTSLPAIRPERRGPRARTSWGRHRSAEPGPRSGAPTRPSTA